MMKKGMAKLVAVCVVFFLIALSVVGCSSTPTESNASNVKPTAEESVAATSAASSPSSDGTIKTGKNGEEIVVSWISYNLNDGGFKAWYEFAQAEAKRIEQRDGVKFKFVPYDSQATLEVQLQICDEVIIKNDSDIVVLEPIDENALAPVIEEMNQKLNCPIGSPSVSSKGGLYIFCGPDNVAATVNDGIAMIDALTAKYGGPENWGEAGGIIVEMWGPAALTVCQTRHTGFHQAIDPVISQYEDIQVVEAVSNWDPEQAFASMSDVIQRYGDKIIAVFADDDTGATQGVVRAFENANMAFPVGDPKHIPIVTYDGTDQGLANVREGNLDCVVEQPFMAQSCLVMRYLYEWFQNGYDSLPKADTVLSEQDLRKYFGDDVGITDWAPVTVVQGEWGGLWFQPTCPVIPQTASASDKIRWGNAWYYMQNGEWPEGVS